MKEKLRAIDKTTLKEPKLTEEQRMWREMSKRGSLLNVIDNLLTNCQRGKYKYSLLPSDASQAHAFAAHTYIHV